MKKLVVLLLLWLPVVALAQKRNLEPENISPKAPLFILDGKETAEDITKTINPDSILRIDVLKDAAAQALYGLKGKNGVVIVITRAYGVKQYQELFSTFSDDFESWLTSHGVNDAQFHYYIDGSEVPKTDAGRNKLLELKKDNIAAVTMVQDEPAGSNYAAKIKIVTKK